VKLCGLLKNGKHTSHKNEVLKYVDKNMDDIYIHIYGKVKDV